LIFTPRDFPRGFSLLEFKKHREKRFLAVKVSLLGNEIISPQDKKHGCYGNNCDQTQHSFEPLMALGVTFRIQVHSQSP